MTQKAIAWFSCGAASAIATVLASIKYGDALEVVYCRVVDEHPDNLKFLYKFSEVTGIPIKVVMNEKYMGSVDEVIEKRNFIKGPRGAQCTVLLKQNVRKQYKTPEEYNDYNQIFGFTTDEKARAGRFEDNNPDVWTDFILIKHGITKQQCYWMLQVLLGLELPAMYKLGYENNNCIGCVKGGMGYWNKIRVDFPEVFAKRAQQERKVGHAICKDKNGPVWLDELDPNRGIFKNDSPGDCGFSCETKNLQPVE